MPTTRSYGDGCGIARALDVVGERWALLVVRELLFGPQRFTDLRRALPGASSNVVADRLRELEAHGVLRRRTLPPPAASKVYELTDRGRALEPAVLALGAWGLEVPLPPDPHIGATSVLIHLRGTLRPTAPLTLAVELDGQVWTVEASPGSLAVTAGEPASPDATLRTDPRTLSSVVDDPGNLAPALASGALTVEGDARAVRRLLASRRARG